jgi:hypothetical protein
MALALNAEKITNKTKTLFFIQAILGWLSTERHLSAHNYREAREKDFPPPINNSSYTSEAWLTY